MCGEHFAATPFALFYQLHRRYGAVHYCFGIFKSKEFDAQKTHNKANEYLKLWVDKRSKYKTNHRSDYIASTRCGLKLKEFFNEVTLQEGTISTHIDLWEQTLIRTIRSMFFLARIKREDGADLVKREADFFHLYILPFLILLY